MTEPFRIGAFGSSSTEGSGATTPENNYPARLDALFRTRRPRPPVEVLNRGIGGEDILAMEARLGRHVLAAWPALVIWQVGSNDPLRGVGLHAFRTALARGTEAMAAAGIEVMLMEPQWGPALDAADPDHAFLAAVRAFGAAHGLTVVKRYDLMQGWFTTGRASPSTAIGPDGLHMTDLGYELLAEAVYGAVTAHSAAYGAAVRRIS